MPFWSSADITGVDFVFGQDEVAHHDVHPGIALRERKPAAESERCRRRPAADRHVEVGARNVDLQHAILEVALLVEGRQARLILRRYVLRAYGRGGWADERQEDEREVPRQSHGILQV